MLSFTCNLPGGPFLGLDAGASGFTEVDWLHAAGGPLGNLLHEAGGEWRSWLHKKGAGQLHLGTLAGVGQCGVSSV